MRPSVHRAIRDADGAIGRALGSPAGRAQPANADDHGLTMVAAGVKRGDCTARARLAEDTNFPTWVVGLSIL
jgi:hypothetical protein